MFGYRRHEDVVELENKMMKLRCVFQILCPHKVVTEEDSVRYSFKCKLCDRRFDEKPKHSKISRMKEVLSDK